MSKGIRNTVLILILVSFYSCKEQKTEFFYLESEKAVTNVRTYEHIVIANPPNNLDSLVVIINKYSNEHLNMCKKMKNIDKKWFNIFFYKESYNMPRDFKSTGDDCWSSEYIGCQTDYIICVIKYGGDFDFEFTARKDVYSDWVEFKYDLDCE